MNRIILKKPIVCESVTQDIVKFAEQCHVLPGDEVTPIVRRYIKWRNCGYSHDDTLHMLKIENEKIFN